MTTKVPDNPEKILETDPIPTKWIMAESLMEIIAGLGMLPLIASELFTYELAFTATTTEVWFASCGILLTTSAIMQEFRTRDMNTHTERIILTLLFAALTFLLTGFLPITTFTTNAISISLLPALFVIVRSEPVNKQMTD